MDAAHSRHTPLQMNSTPKSSNFEKDEIVEKEGLQERHKKNEYFDKISQFPGIGIICALLSVIFYAINSLIVKLLPQIHPVQLSLSRAAVQCLIMIPVLFYKRNEIDVLGPEGCHVLTWLQGLAGAIGVSFLYIAVNLLSLGNAITISYLSVVLSPIMARIFLKESLTVFDIIFAVLSLTGVVLIARPTFLFPVQEGDQSPTNGIGVLFALASATMQATCLVLIRKLGQKASVALNILYFSFCMALSATILLVILGEFRFPCITDLPRVFLLGIVGLSGQVLLVIAIQIERVGTVSVLRSAEIIIVYVLQVTVLGNLPSILSIIGASLVFSSNVGIGIRKIMNEKRKKRGIS